MIMDNAVHPANDVYGKETEAVIVRAGMERKEAEKLDRPNSRRRCKMKVRFAVAMVALTAVLFNYGCGGEEEGNILLGFEADDTPDDPTPIVIEDEVPQDNDGRVAPAGPLFQEVEVCTVVQEAPDALDNEELAEFYDYLIAMQGTTEAKIVDGSVRHEGVVLLERFAAITTTIDAGGYHVNIVRDDISDLLDDVSEHRHTGTLIFGLNDDLKAIHEKWREAFDEYREALLVLRSWVGDGDSVRWEDRYRMRVDAGNELINEYNAELAAYMERIQ